LTRLSFSISAALQTDDTRFALSAILRPATPGIITRIVEEAARSSGARADDVRAYEALMLEMTPPVLDVIAANDEQRATALAALAIGQAEGQLPAPSIPPVVRVGLLEIGIRLGREVVTTAVAGRADGSAIAREFEVLAGQLRTATQVGLRSERQQPR
jgi:hypothetical protein